MKSERELRTMMKPDFPFHRDHFSVLYYIQGIDIYMLTSDINLECTCDSNKKVPLWGFVA